MGTVRGSSLWGWTIPVNGHLSNAFTVSAQDESADGRRTLYGATGARVRTIVVRMNNGSAMKIQPKLPTEQLRKHHVWLRNVRYFVHFYDSGRHAKSVTLLAADGGVIERLQGLEGGFDGSGF